MSLSHAVTPLLVLLTSVKQPPVRKKAISQWYLTENFEKVALEKITCALNYRLSGFVRLLNSRRGKQNFPMENRDNVLIVAATQHDTYTT